MQGGCSDIFTLLILLYLDVQVKYGFASVLNTKIVTAVEPAAEFA